MSDELAREQRLASMMRVAVIAAVVSSIFHYTDNYVRFDQYPMRSEGLESVSKTVVWQTWIVLTAFAALGFVFLRRGQSAVAGWCFAAYSLSGLISPLHYTQASFTSYDAFQHVFILTDAFTGLGVLALAVWLLHPRHRLPESHAR